MPASDGPSPSCRSRRTRRRSSSRAATRCSRERWSSRLSVTAWTRAPTWLPTSSSRRRSRGPNGSREGSTSSRSTPSAAPPADRSTAVCWPRGSPIDVLIRSEAGPRDDLDGGEGQPQAAGEDLEGLAQRILGRGRRIQPTQLGHHPVGEVPVAVHDGDTARRTATATGTQEQRHDTAGHHRPEGGVGGAVHDPGQRRGTPHRRGPTTSWTRARRTGRRSRRAGAAASRAPVRRGAEAAHQREASPASNGRPPACSGSSWSSRRTTTAVATTTGAAGRGSGPAGSAP